VNALPPVILEQRVACAIAAAVKYNIPANLMLAVAEVEGGRPGQVSLNNNGTADLGFLQFNTRYLQTLSRFGIRPEHVQSASCYPFDLAAWRLAGHIAYDTGDLWTRAANYHSRTPAHNAKYRRKLMTVGSKWENWLATNFKTKRVTP
jgi:hypothetical protein